MSKQCGKLYVKEGKNAETDEVAIVYRGFIDLASFSANVFLVPFAGQKETAPDFKIKVQTKSGWREISGGAWIKESERVEGGKFLSLTLDDDDMERPVYVTAFPDDDKPEEVFNVVWSRAKAKADGGRARPKERPIPAGDVPADLDDSIPF